VEELLEGGDVIEEFQDEEGRLKRVGCCRAGLARFTLWKSSTMNRSSSWT